MKSSAEPGKDYVIVDVRDDDFIGGNIKGAVNCPSYTFEEKVEDLVEKTKDVKSQPRAHRCGVLSGDDGYLDYCWNCRSTCGRLQQAGPVRDGLARPPLHWWQCLRRPEWTEHPC